MGKTLSVRLDSQSLTDLTLLEREGLTRSQAIRRAIHEAGERRRKSSSIAAEAALLAQDSEDQAEMAEVRALMEDLSA